jgi:hypothetical protein
VDLSSTSVPAHVPMFQPRSATTLSAGFTMRSTSAASLSNAETMLTDRKCRDPDDDIAEASVG